MTNNKYIFDLTRKDWKYKGILLAECDIELFNKMDDCPMPLPIDYLIDIISLIWTDEKKDWNMKSRLKHPSGNKWVFSQNFKKIDNNLKDINETYILTNFYKSFPMKNKRWFSNKNESAEGIIDLLIENEAIETFHLYINE